MWYGCLGKSFPICAVRRRTTTRNIAPGIRAELHTSPMKIESPWECTSIPQIPPNNLGVSVDGKPKDSQEGESPPTNIQNTSTAIGTSSGKNTSHVLSSIYSEGSNSKSCSPSPTVQKEDTPDVVSQQQQQQQQQQERQTLNAILRRPQYEKRANLSPSTNSFNYSSPSNDDIKFNHTHLSLVNGHNAIQQRSSTENLALGQSSVGEGSTFHQHIESNVEESLSPVSESKMKKKRKQVKRACINCRIAHTGCDVERPCRRCVKLGIGHKCADVEKCLATSTSKEIRCSTPASPPISSTGKIVTDSDAKVISDDNTKSNDPPTIHTNNRAHSSKNVRNFPSQRHGNNTFDRSARDSSILNTFSQSNGTYTVPNDTPTNSKIITHSLSTSQLQQTAPSFAMYTQTNNQQTSQKTSNMKTITANKFRTQLSRPFSSSALIHNDTTFAAPSRGIIQKPKKLGSSHSYFKKPYFPVLQQWLPPNSECHFSQNPNSPSNALPLGEEKSFTLSPTSYSSPSPSLFSQNPSIGISNGLHQHSPDNNNLLHDPNLHALAHSPYSNNDYAIHGQNTNMISPQGTQGREVMKYHSVDNAHHTNESDNQSISRIPRLGANQLSPPSFSISPEGKTKDGNLNQNTKGYLSDNPKCHINFKSYHDAVEEKIQKERDATTTKMDYSLDCEVQSSNEKVLVRHIHHYHNYHHHHHHYYLAKDNGRFEHITSVDQNPISFGEALLSNANQTKDGSHQHCSQIEEGQEEEDNKRVFPVTQLTIPSPVRTRTFRFQTKEINK